MTLLRDDVATKLAFSVHENKGVYALLLGSGLSRSAQIPTGWEITLDLVRRVAVAQGVADQSDWAAWYRDKTGKDPSYSELMKEIGSSPGERRALLHRYIEPSEEDLTEGRKLPTKAHHAIAQLVRSGHVRVIVTTNFDRLMENALRELGVEPTVVSSADALSGAEPLTHSKCYLLKLHGDYKDARILNTDEELSVYPEVYDRLLDRLFDEHGLVVCGWSGEWDPALRTALLRAPNRRYATYWVARGELGSGAADLVRHRQASVLQVVGADEFFASLSQRVGTLERSDRQNPQSTELLVNTAKRFLARSEHRIQLDELLSTTAETLLRDLDGEAFVAQGELSPAILRHRIALYESMAEPLARVCGTLGRWGDDDEFDLVADILRALHGHAAKVGSGLTVLLNLRAYPAVLAFTAYGIGLTKAKRWHVLHRLFSSAITFEYREPKRLVSALFLGSWVGGGKEVWQRLDGMERRKTPLSDHLYNIMCEWKPSFVGVDHNFELLFERFETLASLAALEENSEAALEAEAQAAATRSTRDVLAYMPMGRIGWHESSLRAILQEIKSDNVARALLEAGFARGSPRFLELFLQNLQLYSRQMSFS